MAMTLQFINMTSLRKHFEIVLFILSSLVTSPSFMSISPLVMELWQFFLKGIDQKSGNQKYPRLIFAQSADWGKLGITKLARISLTKWYWMLENARITSFMLEIFWEQLCETICVPKILFSLFIVIYESNFQRNFCNIIK